MRCRRSPRRARAFRRAGSAGPRRRAGRSAVARSTTESSRVVHLRVVQVEQLVAASTRRKPSARRFSSTVACVMRALRGSGNVMSSRLPSGSASTASVADCTVSGTMRRSQCGTVRASGTRPQQAHEVVRLRRGADGGAAGLRRVLLLDGDRRAQPVDHVDEPASPSGRGTASRTSTATRRSGAGPRRRACRTRATTCRTRSVPSRRRGSGAGCRDRCPSDCAAAHCG
jgi:hypothetical protein